LVAVDVEYLNTLGPFDVVYSWGVLHHTGAMCQAFGHLAPLVADRGQLFVAIYNDEGLKSRYWHAVKRTYVRHPLLRWPLVLLHVPYPFLASLAFRWLSGRWNNVRGVSYWHDLIDWIGGFPFDVATPEALFECFRPRGFRLNKLRTTSRSGCNELVLMKDSARV
jgi:hypothetical protein